jgi:hypothetical protein
MYFAGIEHLPVIYNRLLVPTNNPAIIVAAPSATIADGADFGVGVGAGVIAIERGVVCPEFTVAVPE